MEVAELSKSRGISDELAFYWWVPYVLSKHDRLIATINSMVNKPTQKYGVQVSHNLQHAKDIDNSNGNKLLVDTIKTEIYNVSLVFEILNEGEKAPPGWNPESGHINFDGKIDFTRKARWFKDSNKTPDIDRSTYDGVVSYDSVILVFTYAVLSNISITSTEICNVYLRATSSEKRYIICGVDFGLEYVDKVVLIQ